MILHENRLPADDSHEILYLIFCENEKRSQNLSSAAVVIGALRVNFGLEFEKGAFFPARME